MLTWRAAVNVSPEFDARVLYADPLQSWVAGQAAVHPSTQNTTSSPLHPAPRLYGDTYDYQHYADTSWGAACLPYGSNTCRQYALGVSRWAGADMQASFDWLEDASLVTLIGADARLRDVASKTDLLDYDSAQS